MFLQYADHEARRRLIAAADGEEERLWCAVRKRMAAAERGA